MKYVWFFRSRLPERKGQPCRVLLRVRRTNSIVVEFADGYRVNTSRWAVRRINRLCRGSEGMTLGKIVDDRSTRDAKA